MEFSFGMLQSFELSSSSFFFDASHIFVEKDVFLLGKAKHRNDGQSIAQVQPNEKARMLGQHSP